MSFPITGFSHFNSALQRKHFCKKYTETGKFGPATFAVKMLNIGAQLSSKHGDGSFLEKASEVVSNVGNYKYSTSK